MLATNSALERVVRTLPGGEQVAWRAAARYVAGKNADAAFATARRLHAEGVGSSIDLFGELVQDVGVAERTHDDYMSLAGRLAELPEDVWLSIDLSHLGLDVDPTGCADRLTAIARRMPGGRRLQVGAEDHGRADAVLECVRHAAAAGVADRLGATVQANLRRATDDLDTLAEMGVYIRLVKGAYVESHEVALPYGEATDVAYLQLAHRAAEVGADFALATHDAVLREALLAALGPRPVEQLLGVRSDTLDELVARGVPVRVYVPYGHDWFRYFMRRLAESRGA